MSSAVLPRVIAPGLRFRAIRFFFPVEERFRFSSKWMPKGHRQQGIYSQGQGRRQQWNIAVRKPKD